MLEERPRRAVCREVEPRDGEAEVSRARQPRRDVSGAAVRRHDVEPDGGHERDSASPGLGTPPCCRLEHGDLTGEVERVHAAAQAGVDHGSRHLREGACAVQDDIDAVERRVE
jgi:hypothetical protein